MRWVRGQSSLRFVRTIAITSALGLSLVPQVGPDGDPDALVRRGVDIAAETSVGYDTTIVYYTTQAFAVRSDAVVQSFEPLRLSPGLELLAVRATFIGDRASGGRPTHNVLFSGQCLRTWPPGGFGDSWDARGLRVAAGDRVAFTLFLRVRGTGSLVASGYRLRWKQDGTTRTYLTERGFSLATVRLPPDRSTSAFCNPEAIPALLRG